MKKPKALHVDTSTDTTSSTTMTQRAAKVGEVAPSADLYKGQADLAKALDAFVAEGPLLVAAEAQVVKDDAQAAKSRGARDALRTSIAGTYNIAVSTLEKYARKSADITDCGFVELLRASYPVAAPLQLTVTFDKAKELIDIHVKHAPGMRACHVELSPEPIGPASFKRLDGIAAEYHLAGYAPGTWWVRAQSVRGTEVSAWIGPVSVVVK